MHCQRIVGIDLIVDIVLMILLHVSGKQLS